MKQPLVLAVALVLCLTLVGCSTTYSDQVSFLDGDRFYRANIHTSPTRITAVDGESTFIRENPVRVEPGEHVVRVVTAPTAGFTVAEARELKLNIEPCSRYFIVAERDNRLLQDWRPVVDHVAPSGGKRCP
jgi:hypothetical protein